MPDFIAQAGEWWAGDEDTGSCNVYEHDPRTPRQRHDDHYSGLVANYPGMERWVVIDEHQKSVSGMRPGKRYEIARCHCSVSNWKDDDTPSAMSLTRAEYGAPRVNEYVQIERLHKTQEAAVDFLRSMHDRAVCELEAEISILRASINELNGMLSALPQPDQGAGAGEMEGGKS